MSTLELVQAAVMGISAGAPAGIVLIRNISAVAKEFGRAVDVLERISVSLDKLERIVNRLEDKLDSRGAA